MFDLMRGCRARALRYALLCCAIATGGLLLWASQASATEGAPTIDSIAVTNITEHGATIEAQINPEGGETLYEIRLFWQDAHPPSEGEPLTGGIQSTEVARIRAGFGDQTVSLALTGLHPGYSYWYLVRAGNRAGEVNGEGKTRHWFGFHNSVVYPEGFAPNWGYEPVVSFWSYRAAEETAAKIVNEVQEERRRAAQALAEQREREAAAMAAAAAPRLATEVAERKRVEKEEAVAKSVTYPVPPCVVPSLKGDTLSAARRALTRHHCRLGKVHWPRHRRGTLVVIAQNPKHGRTLADGTSIAVTLGPRRRR